MTKKSRDTWCINSHSGLNDLSDKLYATAVTVYRCNIIGGCNKFKKVIKF